MAVSEKTYRVNEYNYRRRYLDIRNNEYHIHITDEIFITDKQCGVSRVKFDKESLVLTSACGYELRIADMSDYTHEIVLRFVVSYNVISVEVRKKVIKKEISEEVVNEDSENIDN